MSTDTEGTGIDRREAGLRRELEAMVLGGSDMRQAAAGARYLVARGDEMPSDARRALWAGVVVCYARPFTRSRRYRALSSTKWAPSGPVERTVHHNLLLLRHEVFAHTDETKIRRVIDIASTVGATGGILVEEYLPIGAEQWRHILTVAEGQAERMYGRELELRAELRLPRSN